MYFHKRTKRAIIIAVELNFVRASIQQNGYQAHSTALHAALVWNHEMGLFCDFDKTNSALVGSRWPSGGGAERGG
jgi:hypothetical protein